MYGPPAGPEAAVAATGAAATKIAATAPSAITSARLYAPLGALMCLMGAAYVEQGKCGR